ncbi:MAG: DUF2726 domain-containing protein [Ruminococcus flavefaciens]|nr:DUF2726 domain-containing protein [Ruminococcus flavefaciens]MCM1061196.1 DUF2726 domain-containing protein [Eubacterium sp.]
MTEIVLILLIVVLLAVFIVKKGSLGSRRGDKCYPYHRKKLLTQNEYRFYQKLKEITRPLGLQILAKIRLADLVEVNKGLDGKQWGYYFGKIKAKHIDFALADNMEIIALIELDDSTHQRADRQERDIFVNNVLEKTGYDLIRTYGDMQPVNQFLESIGFKVRTGK